MRARIILNIVLVLVVLGGAGGGVVWMITRPKPGKPEPPPAPVPKVVAETIVPIENYTVRIVGYGSVRPQVRVEIVPQVSGEIVPPGAAPSTAPATRPARPTCRSGMYVRKGQVLFIQRYSPHEMIHGVDNFVDQHHKFRTCQGAMIHPATAIMHQPRSYGGSRQALKGGFRTGLGVTKF